MVTLYRKTQNINNLSFLWKIAVLGTEKPPVGVGTSCPSPMLVFYIPSCQKTFTAWRGKMLAWARDKMFPHQQGLFHSQNCNFPEESFILISFCYSVAWRVNRSYLLEQLIFSLCIYHSSHKQKSGQCSWETFVFKVPWDRDGKHLCGLFLMWLHRWTTQHVST